MATGGKVEKNFFVVSWAKQQLKGSFAGSSLSDPGGFPAASSSLPTALYPDAVAVCRTL
jgi:hypothetical protein